MSRLLPSLILILAACSADHTGTIETPTTGLYRLRIEEDFDSCSLAGNTGTVDGLFVIGVPGEIDLPVPPIHDFDRGTLGWGAGYPVLAFGEEDGYQGTYRYGIPFGCPTVEVSISRRILSASSERIELEVVESWTGLAGCPESPDTPREDCDARYVMSYALQMACNPDGCV